MSHAITHTQQIPYVTGLLQTAGLTMKRYKCILGHQKWSMYMSQDKLWKASISPKIKIKAIRDAPKLQSVNFCPMCPLHSLLSPLSCRQSKDRFGERNKQQLLKQLRICQSPVPCWYIQKLILLCDTSPHDVGALLSHAWNGRWIRKPDCFCRH